MIGPKKALANLRRIRQLSDSSIDIERAHAQITRTERQTREQLRQEKIRAIPFGKHPADRLIKTTVRGTKKTGKLPRQIFEELAATSPYESNFLLLRYHAGLSQGRLLGLPKTNRRR